LILSECVAFLFCKRFWIVWIKIRKQGGTADNSVPFWDGVFLFYFFDKENSYMKEKLQKIKEEATRQIQASQ